MHLAGETGWWKQQADQLPSDTDFYAPHPPNPRVDGLRTGEWVSQSYFFLRDQQCNPEQSCLCWMEWKQIRVLNTNAVVTGAHRLPSQIRLEDHTCLLPNPHYQTLPRAQELTGQNNPAPVGEQRDHEMQTTNWITYTNWIRIIRTDEPRISKMHNEYT